jgi:hypothetical protein
VANRPQLVQYYLFVPQEKKAAMLADEEEQRRLDMEMEVERIKALEAYHVREAKAFRGPHCDCSMDSDIAAQYHDSLFCIRAVSVQCHMNPSRCFRCGYYSPH